MITIAKHENGEKPEWPNPRRASRRLSCEWLPGETKALESRCSPGDENGDAVDDDGDDDDEEMVMAVVEL